MRIMLLRMLLHLLRWAINFKEQDMGKQRVAGNVYNAWYKVGKSKDLGGDEYMDVLLK